MEPQEDVAKSSQLPPLPPVTHVPTASPLEPSSSPSSPALPQLEPTPSPTPSPTPQPANPAPTSLHAKPPPPPPSSSTPSPPPPQPPPTLPSPQAAAAAAAPRRKTITKSATAAGTTTTTPTSFLPWQQRRTATTPSFTQRKKMQRMSSEEQRWRKTDLNLIQYMSRLKEQYMQRQTEHDLQLRRQKVLEHSFDSEVAPVKGDCVPVTKLTIEAIDSVQGEGELAVEEQKSPESVGGRSPRQMRKSFIPIRSPTRSSPPGNERGGIDKTNISKALDSGETKETPPLPTVNSDEIKTSASKTAKLSWSHRSFRENSTSKKPASRGRVRTASFRSDTATSSGGLRVSGMSSLQEHQQLRGAQRRASTGTVQRISVDSLTKTKPNVFANDEPMAGERPKSSNPALKMYTDSHSTANQMEDVESLGDLPIGFSSAESSPLTFNQLEQQMGQNKELMSTWSESQRDQKMAALRNAFSIVKRNPAHVPPVHVFHTEERANRRNRKTRFSLDYRRSSRARAITEQTIISHDKQTGVKGSRNSTPMPKPENEAKPKLTVPIKSETGDKMKKKIPDKVLPSSPTRCKDVARDATFQTPIEENKTAPCNSAAKTKSPIRHLKQTGLSQKTLGATAQNLRTTQPKFKTKHTASSPTSKSMQKRECGKRERKNISADSRPKHRNDSTQLSEQLSKPAKPFSEPKGQGDAHDDQAHLVDLISDYQKPSPEMDSGKRSSVSKSPEKKPQTWTIDFTAGATNEGSKVPQRFMPARRSRQKTDSPQAGIKTPSLARKSSADKKPKKSKTSRKERKPRQPSTSESKLSSPSLSQIPSSCLSHSISPEQKSIVKSSQISPRPSRKGLGSPVKPPINKKRTGPSRATDLGEKSKDTRHGKPLSSQIPHHTSQVTSSGKCQSLSPGANRSERKSLKQTKTRHQIKATTTKDTGQTKDDRPQSPIADPEQDQLSTEDSEDACDFVGLNLVNDRHDSPSENYLKHSDDDTVKSSKEGAENKEQKVDWNRSESNVRVYKHAGRDKTKGTDLPAQRLINLVDHQDKQDKPTTSSATAAERKQQHHAVTKAAPWPTQTDHLSESKSPPDIDWSVIDIEESSPTRPGAASDRALTGQDSPVLDMLTRERIEADLEEVLTQLYKSQYNIALRVVNVKEELMRLRENLALLPPAKSTRKPMDCDKWDGTLLDYLMLVGFMVIQVVVQFILVKA